jgi:hypothetical protein
VAQRILASLSEAFVFKTSEPMHEGARPSQCVFRVAYGSQLTFRKLAALLSAIPGVRLRADPNGGEAH